MGPEACHVVTNLSLLRKNASSANELCCTLHRCLMHEFLKHELSMNQDKEFKSRSKKRKREEGKSFFLKGCQAGFSGLPSHLSGLSTGMDLCWLAPSMARLSTVCLIGHSCKLDTNKSSPLRLQISFYFIRISQKLSYWHPFKIWSFRLANPVCNITLTILSPSVFLYHSALLLKSVNIVLD